MNIVWSELHGAYLCRRSAPRPALPNSTLTWSTVENAVLSLCRTALPSLVCQSSSKVIQSNRKLFSFDIRVAGYPVKVQMHLDTVKAASIVCLIGISIGLGLTSWVLCKFYRKDRKSTQAKALPCSSNSTLHEYERRQSEDGDIHNREGLNSLSMGNSEGRFTAEIQVYSDLQSREELFQQEDGIRHRSTPTSKTTTPNKSTHISASIVDEDSGAYISRSTDACCSICNVSHCEQHRTNGHATAITLFSSQNNSTHQNDGAVASTSRDIMPVQQLQHVAQAVDIMKDSGYLENEHLDNTVDDHTGGLTPAEDSVQDLVTDECNNKTSARSSLSDPFHLDLAGERSSSCSSCCASCEREDDAGREDELCVEFQDIDGASVNTLLGSLGEYDKPVKPIEEPTTLLPENAVLPNSDESVGIFPTSNGSVKQEYESSTSSAKQQNTDTTESSPATLLLTPMSSRDGWTTDSDWAEELTRLGNDTCSSDTSSPLYLPRPLGDLVRGSPQVTRRVRSRSSSFKNESPSPVLSQRAASLRDSRSNSITSGDMDFEALSDTDETVETYETLEQEIREITDEMDDLSENIRSLMLKDSSELHFNVDGMRKLTRVMLSEDSLDISSSELSKAFDILRKYRYTAASDTDSSCSSNMHHYNEAESLPSPRKPKKSLSHLDLAEGFSLQDEKTIERIRSEPPVGEAKKYVIYENQNNQWEVVTDDTVSIADSESTLETSLCSSTRFTSVESINLSGTQPEMSTCTKNIIEYAEQEWRGSTPTAQTMLQGYHSISQDHNLLKIYKIRGDNYCALRASYCSCILHQKKIIVSDSIEETLETLQKMFSGSHKYLNSWRFGNRIPIKGHDGVLPMMKFCLQTFQEQTTELASLTDVSQREAALSDLINSASMAEICIMEAIKLHMFISAARLFEMNIQGKEVPVFIWLMFARDSSETLQQFFTNHLNKVGDTAGLEQVEMFLLGHTLGVKLKVFRPSQYGREDFVTFYPDNEDTSSHVPILAEDDRHYNVAL